MKELQIAGKQVKIHFASAAGAPTIYLNAYANEGDELVQILRERDGYPSALKLFTCVRESSNEATQSQTNELNFTLVIINGIDWGAEMTPWASEAIFRGEPPFAGKGGEYLRLLEEQIVPAVERETGIAAWRGLIGYSLGGLFALYAAYRSEVFARVASVSGSLWYADFERFALSEPLSGGLERAYLSIGDKESAGKNQRLKGTESTTRAVAAHLEQLGVQVKFELNQGGHYTDELGRLSRAIEWLAS